MNTPTYHLVYHPGNNRIISVISTHSTALIACHLTLDPDIEAMQLEAQSPEELNLELRDLGFIH